MKKTYINLKSLTVLIFLLLMVSVNEILAMNAKHNAEAVIGPISSNGEIRNIKSTENSPENLTNVPNMPLLSEGYHVQWTDLEGVQVDTDGGLVKTVVDGWGNAGAASIQGLSEGVDGWVEFQVLAGTKGYMVGLSAENIDLHWMTQRYSIFIDNNGTFSVHEGGVGRANLGAYVVGDIFKIERTGTTIKYYRNNQEVYISKVASEGQLLVDVALLNSGAVISNVITSFNTEYIPVAKVGYPVQWTDLEGVQVDVEGNLEKIEVDGWGNAGAASTQGLAEGSDGWVEFQVFDRTKGYMVGLSAENIDSHWFSQRYSIFINGTGKYSIHEGGIGRIELGEYLIGDVFRIERSGQTIRYLRNNQVVYTSQVTSEGQLLVDVALLDSGAVISDIHTSFNTDYVAKVRSGYPVEWVDVEGLVLNSDGNLEKNVSQGWGNAGAASNQGLPQGADGWVEFQALSRTKTYMIGISPENLDSHWLTQRYSIYIRNTGVYGIYEGGMAIKNLGDYLVGDVFKIERTGNVIKYFRNGEVVYTSAYLLEDQLLVDISLGDSGTVVPDIRTSFNEVYTKTPKPGYEVQWTDIEGAEVNFDGTLIKTEADGWGNGGAASKYSLGPGEDGWVEFQVFSRGRNFMVGLSEVNSDADYRSLQYAIQISGTRNGYVREDGVAKFALSNYLTGETFRIERTGNTIKYLRNGSVAYISKISSEGVLLVDVAMATPGTELREVRSSFSYSEEIPDVYEIAALQELYESTDGPNWTNNAGWPTDWSTITSIDQVVGWHGVTVENGDVTAIALSSNQLTGSLPASIGSLRALKTLSLANNQLINGIPAEIRNLSNLETLTLFSNPSIGGEIPPEIGNLTALKDLSLNNMGLTGTVPSTLGNLTNLLSLRIDQNNLTGGLPVELAKLVNLSKIYFGSNPGMDFGGAFPLAIRGMTSLTWLDVNNTPINAPLPEWIGELSKLSAVTLQNCTLTGAIPEGIGNLILLKQLYLSNNQLSGALPKSIGNLHQLVKLELNNNNLSGEVPASIGGCVALLNLDLSFNALSGSFPETINAHTNIIDIYLHNNNFTSFPAVSNVDVLYLKNNLLDYASLEAQMIDGVKKFRILNYNPQKQPDTEIETALGGNYKVANDRSGGEYTTYQWQEWDGTVWQNLAGKTDADLLLAEADATYIGKRYRCEMKNTVITDITLYSSSFVITDVPDPVPVNFEVKPLYNGNITSMKWATAVPDDAEPFEAGTNINEGIYLFDYDEKYQLKEAVWGEEVTGIVQHETNKYRLNNLQYDLNGNIMSLRRYDGEGSKKHDFKYDYNIDEEGNDDNTVLQNNQLDKITGHATYHYNEIGQLTAEIGDDGKEKYVDYDVTGKVVAVYADADKKELKVSYKYDDRGFRLMSRKEDTATETWYIRDASGNVMSIYERKDETNDLVQTEVPVYGSGKLGVYYPQQDGTVDYELTDHLGNVRTVVKKRKTIYTATMEDTGTGDYSNPRVEEMAYFQADNLFAIDHKSSDPGLNVTSTDVVANPQYSALLDGSLQRRVGPAITLKVEPGDQVDMQAFAKFKIQETYNQLALADVVAALTSTYIGANGLETASELESLFTGALSGFASSAGNTPDAYLNYIIFDATFNVVTSNRMRVSESAGFYEGNASATEFELLDLDQVIDITQEGYIYVYASNESPDSEVYFDDVSVTLTENVVTQATDYYPFGMVMRRSNTPNNYVHNEGEPTMQESEVLNLPLAGDVMDDSPLQQIVTSTGITFGAGKDEESTAAIIDQNGSVVIDDAASLEFSNKDFTIAFWVKGDASVSEPVELFSIRKDGIYGAPESGYEPADVAISMIHDPTSEGQFSNSYNSGENLITFNYTDNQFNEWTHIAIVRNGPWFDVYANGERKDALQFDDPSFGFNDSDAPIQIKKILTNAHQTRLQNFHIFKKSLSLQEIRLLMDMNTSEEIDETITGQLAFGGYYRYGFQGQFAEEDSETGWNSFELRMYDPVIGRWLTTDPYGQYWSPYVGMGNNPTNLVDPDGGCTGDCPEEVQEFINAGGTVLDEIVVLGSKNAPVQFAYRNYQIDPSINLNWEKWALAELRQKEAWYATASLAPEIFSVPLLLEVGPKTPKLPSPNTVNIVARGVNEAKTFVNIITKEDGVMIFSAKYADEVIQGISDYRVHGDKLYLEGLHLQGSSGGNVGVKTLY
ncbi:leucine-rich repeat domain-containing protein, partial [Fulvivirga kasyanovii]